MKNQIIIRNGLYSGIFLLAAFLLSYFIIGNEPENYGLGEVIGYATIVLSLVFVFLGIRQYSQKATGSLSFLSALKIGLLIALFPAVAFGAYNVIYIEILDPEFIDTYYNYQLEQMEAELSSSEYLEARATMEEQKDMFANPFMQFIVMFLTVWVIGLIVSIISSLILSKKSLTVSE